MPRPLKNPNLNDMLCRQVLQSKIKSPTPVFKGVSGYDMLSRPSIYALQLLAERDGEKISNSKNSNRDGEEGQKSENREFDGEKKGKNSETSNRDGERLKDFLARERKPKEPNPTKSQELHGLREELASLVTLEEKARIKDKRQLHAQKAKVLSEIRVLEAKQRNAETERRRVKPDLSLPPPIDPIERKKLMKATRKVQEAKTGEQKNPKKRQDKGSDDDLDGEERLRLGKRLKQSKPDITGRWESRLSS